MTTEPSPIHRRLYHVLSALIVLFWVGMMSALMAYEIWPRRFLGNERVIPPKELAEQWRDLDECQELLSAGKSMGVVRTRVVRQESGDYLAGTSLRLRADISPVVPVALRADAVASLNTRLEMSNAVLDAEFLNTRLRAEASYGGDDLTYLIEVNDQLSGGEVTLGAPPSFYEATRSMLARRFDLEVGVVYAVPVFDPLWQFGDGVARLRVAAKEPIELEEGQSVEAFRIETYFGDLKTTAWVDEQGRTLRQHILGDLYLERITVQEALQRYPDLGGPMPWPKIDHERMRKIAEKTKGRPDNALGALGLLSQILQSR